ncbi:hypothetical protein HK102_009751, partial [Quaeritorhiza haematococci]
MFASTLIALALSATAVQSTPMLAPASRFLTRRNDYYNHHHQPTEQTSGYYTEEPSTSTGTYHRSHDGDTHYTSTNTYHTVTEGYCQNPHWSEFGFIYCSDTYSGGYDYNTSDCL